MSARESRRKANANGSGIGHGNGNGERAWWCGAGTSEIEVLGAAVVCAAIAASTSAVGPDDGSGDVAKAKATIDASRREIEAFLRASPLPHRLVLPALAVTPRVVLVESASAVICAVRATQTRDIVDAVLGSTLPLSQPYVYRYGGARIHLPFWKRAQQLDLEAAYNLARERQKTLLLCGHSIGGSIAQLGLCELVYQRLPPGLREEMEARDAETRRLDLQRPQDPTDGGGDQAATRRQRREDYDRRLREWATQEDVLEALPHVMAMGFGSPYVSSQELQAYLENLALTRRMITFVNEFDCIPGILNVAQSTALVTKTTERFLTITKATSTLLKLLPAHMQGLFVRLHAGGGCGGSSGLASMATTSYISMTLTILQNTFHRFRALNVVKDLDYQYGPCGTYLFMRKLGKDFTLLSDVTRIQELLVDTERSSTLTGDAILQHLMSAYVEAIARRSTSIQINETMNYYERLNVPPSATPRQIRTAYKSLALKWHPDRWSGAVNPREKEMAEQVFKLLAESYEVLSDPEARRAYDAHLARAPSLAEEFVRQGTVRGMTLDEAIATFRDVLDGATGAISHVSSKFTSSSSSVVGQARIRRADPLAGQGLVANNHNNLFAPDRVRVARKVGLGAEQQEKILYVQPDDLLPGDVAAPLSASHQDPNAAASGMKSISVLGGAVVVGAGVALAVSAWNQYSEGSKRKMQADTVRNMPGEYLLLLMDDHRAHQAPAKTKTITDGGGESTATTSPAPTQEATPKTDRTETPATASEGAIVVQASTDLAAALDKTGSPRDEDDELLEEFFDCVSDYEDARLQAFAEDEFFECVDIAEAVTAYFPDAHADPVPLSKPSDLEAGFPVGAAVRTPFGLGTLEEWRDGATSAVVRFDRSCFGFIQKTDIQRGGSLALTTATRALEERRVVLAERVVAKYHLEASANGGTLTTLVQAGKEGALDSGLRAAGGVAIAKGMSKAAPALGGAVAAPLTIASILVDIGKEYYEFRQRHHERRNMGVLSTTSERLMMKDFRLKAGQHIVSGTAAAAGASLGAYGVATTIGFWTGVGITGPVGVVAATGAAVVGGMLGFFAGSKAYHGYTSSYFTSYKTAKEQIDRLELGARILFNEYDPSGSGAIRKEDCIAIMSKLYEASGAVSECGYHGAVAVLEDEMFEGPVSWAMFWEWVSTEAAKSLRKLEQEEQKAQADEQVSPQTQPSTDDAGGWWASYRAYFSYGNAALASTEQIADSTAALYPSVMQLFKFGAMRALAVPMEAAANATTGSAAAVDAAELMILRAQMEYLVNVGSLTESDAFQLEQLLLARDGDIRESARRTITTLHEGQVDANGGDTAPGPGGGIISDGFSGIPVAEDGGGGDDDKEEAATTNTRRHGEHGAASRPPRSLSQDQTQMDVLCSLLSTSGLQQFLHTQHVDVPVDATTKHEDLHCLALLTAAPPSTAVHL